MNPVHAGVVGLSLASILLLALAWLIGVQGMLRLISNYRAHPERYPDGAGLGRWMGWTLTAGGASFGLLALAVGSEAISPLALGPWAGATGLALGGLAFAGLSRYRRRAPPGDGSGKARP
ncbi:MAG: hypothetical protein IPP91_12705 [Betaproteobacteria bacterium]|nr:hypothetical protein [Betaproteobacteria bacterium]